MLGFDIETTGLMHDPDARISVVCTIDSDTGLEVAYNFLNTSTAEEYGALRLQLISALNAARVLCAYNAVLFDIPFIEKELKVPKTEVQGWLLKLFDPFHAMKTCFNFTCKLDKMLALNGLECKSASGLEAIDMAKNKEWDALISYCMDDVRLTVLICQQPQVILFQHSDGFYICCAHAPTLEATPAKRALRFWAIPSIPL